MVNTQDARIRKSQAAIISAGLELLNKNSDASLSEIAQKAGVGRTTLYRIYETKEQLVKAVAMHCLEVFDKATEHLERDANSAIDAFRLMFKDIIPLAAELEYLMKIDDLAEDDPELVAIYQKQQNEMAELVEYAKSEGSIKKKVPTLWVVNHLEGLFYASWLTQSEGIMSHDELADLMFQTFCSGVKP